MGSPAKGEVLANVQLVRLGVEWLLPKPEGIQAPQEQQSLCLHLHGVLLVL